MRLLLPEGFECVEAFLATRIFLYRLTTRKLMRAAFGRTLAAE
jgi:hypothetical protein